MKNENLYWRWKNGEHPDKLAKEAGVTRERMKHRLQNLEADAGFLVAVALRDMVQAIDDFRENYDGVYNGMSRTPWDRMDKGGSMDAWLAEYRAAKEILAKIGAI